MIYGTEKKSQRGISFDEYINYIFRKNTFRMIQNADMKKYLVHFIQKVDNILILAGIFAKRPRTNSNTRG